MTTNKHNARCSVCNKFVTWTDLLDDGLCGACERVVNRLAEERTRLLTRMVYTAILVAFAGLALCLFLLVTCDKVNAETMFREEYFVTGTNTETGERVVGWIDGVLGESEVQGTVWDRAGQYVVVGVANGKGSFELRSLCCVYDVVVTDEVSESKQQNRKTWEKK